VVAVAAADSASRSAADRERQDDRMTGLLLSYHPILLSSLTCLPELH
jgi:hypothetical protein